MKKINTLGIFLFCFFITVNCSAWSDNQYSDEDKQKVAGIEAGAEANSPLVDQSTAEAGTSTTEYSWSPLRVFQAISAWIAVNTIGWDKDASNDVVTSGDQTIGGIKTFSSSPVVLAPTTDMQAATKKYVDDNSGTGDGDVTGPELATTNNVVVFADETGKVLKDGGAPPTDGTDGEEIQIQVAGGYIQWKYESDITWTNLIATAALEGDPGAAGLDGDDGIDGYSVLHVEGVPGIGTGNDGDFCINTLTWDIYGSKTAGAWGTATSLIGANGDPFLYADFTPEQLADLRAGNTAGNTTGNTVGNTTGNTVGNDTNNTAGNTTNNTDGNTAGNTVGNTVGNTLNNTDGNMVGNTTSNTDGNTVGNTIGNDLNNTDGNTTGNTTGNTAGNTDGNTIGNTVGNTVGNDTNNTDGNTVGNTAGNTVGNDANNTVGNTTGNTVGNTDGNTAGNTTGNTTGNTIGTVQWKGVWSAGSYLLNDGVSNDGTSYVANKNTSSEPPHADWDVMAASGVSTDDQTAAEVSVVTTNFSGHLANDVTSDTVQECLDLLDDITTGSTFTTLSADYGFGTADIGTDGVITHVDAGAIDGSLAVAITLGDDATTAEGKIGWDATLDQLEIGTGSAVQKITGKYSKSFCILAPVATDDYPVWRVPYAITIISAHVQCLGGTNIIGQLTECDGEGINPAVVDSADITATANNSVDDDGTLSNPSIDAGDYVGWKTESISGTPTSVTVTFDYTVN